MEQQERSNKLLKKGIEIFGADKSFHMWLNIPSFGLGHQIPFNLMDTITGINLVEEELIRIEFGDLA